MDENKQYRVKCIVSYDGSSYMGFQIQGELKTVELEIINALKNITNDDIKIYASGRTDRGVHALGQVFHFDTCKNIHPNGWMKALNSFLPDDIRILDVEIVDDEFHSRFCAIKKEYRYYIKTDGYDLFKRNYLVFYDNLDIDLMKEALKHLEGTHNFKGFCSASVDERKDFVKTIYTAKLNINDNILEFVFEGTGFLKYQIRRMMGLIIEIGLKRQSIDMVDKVLETMDPKISHKNAKPNGLYLYKVTYKEE